MPVVPCPDVSGGGGHLPVNTAEPCAPSACDGGLILADAVVNTRSWTARLWHACRCRGLDRIPRYKRKRPDAGNGGAL